MLEPLLVLLARLGMGCTLATALQLWSTYDGTAEIAARVAIATDTARIAQLSTSDLIDQLPVVGAESRWDDGPRKLVEHPAVVELRRRLEAGTVLTDQEWQRALRRSRAIQLRSRWPVSEPLAMSMEIPNWLGVTQIRATTNVFGGREAKAGSLTTSWCGSDGRDERDQLARYQVLGVLPLGTFRIPFEVAVVRGSERGLILPRDRISPTPGLLWRGTLEFEVTIVQTIDEAWPAVDDKSVATAVRESIRGHVYRSSSDSRELTMSVVVDPNTDAFPALATTALSLLVEALRDGVLVQSERLAASRFDRGFAGNSGSPAYLRFFGASPLDRIPGASLEDESELARWSLRITGTNEALFKFWDAEAHWSGQIEMPLSEALARSKTREAANR